MTTFDDLVASRKSWIEDILKPWCRQAARKDLLLAEQDWPNLAGRVDAERTLWLWAWSRFPLLVAEGLSGIEETYEVVVTRKDGVVSTGFPDARESRQGRLVLHSEDGGPMALDDIASIERA